MSDLDAALRAATTRLSAAGLESPHREARILLMHALGSDQSGLLRRRGGTLTPEEAETFRVFIDRRAAREPTALIVGHREFWSLDFLVTADTLIPRPESEIVIETALDLCPRPSVRHVLDLGTGSGCLLLSALSEFAGAWGLGVDLNPAAACVAAANAARLGFGMRASLLVGRWAEAVAGRFDLILCNPPYIPSADLAGLMPEVVGHEPRLALDGGADGLDPYHTLFAEMPRLLAPGGLALFEFGIGQADALAGLARTAGLRVVETRADLAGIARVLAVSHP